MRKVEMDALVAAANVEATYATLRAQLAELETATSEASRDGKSPSKRAGTFLNMLDSVENMHNILDEQTDFGGYLTYLAEARVALLRQSEWRQ